MLAMSHPRLKYIHSSSHPLTHSSVHPLFSSHNMLNLNASIDILSTTLCFLANAQCNETISSIVTKGIVKSPNYPESYPSDTECQWRLWASPADSVGWQFASIRARPVIARNSNNITRNIWHSATISWDVIRTSFIHVSTSSIVH